MVVQDEVCVGIDNSPLFLFSRKREKKKKEERDAAGKMQKSSLCFYSLKNVKLIQ